MNLDLILEVLTLSDFIQIVGILISLLTSIVAIAISIFTLRQNSKMIEESTRPVIAIYSKYSQDFLYIVIKNHGSSPARIRKLTCSHSFADEETTTRESGDIFEKYQNSLLAPGSCCLCPLHGNKLQAEQLDFYIEYSSSSRTYRDNFSVCWKAECCFPNIYSSGKTELDYLKIIANTLEDEVKSNL